GKMRIDRHAGLFVNSDRGIALDRDERAELFIGELRHSFGDVMDGLAFFARERKNWMAAQLSQAAAQFRLENHHQRDGEKNGETPDDPADHDEVQQLRDQGQGQENDGQASEHFRAAGPTEIKIAVINPNTQQDDFNEAAPALDPKLKDLLHHFA